MNDETKGEEKKKNSKTKFVIDFTKILTLVDYSPYGDIFIQNETITD